MPVTRLHGGESTHKTQQSNNLDVGEGFWATLPQRRRDVVGHQGKANPASGRAAPMGESSWTTPSGRGREDWSSRSLSLRGSGQRWCVSSAVFSKVKQGSAIPLHGISPGEMKPAGLCLLICNLRGRCPPPQFASGGVQREGTGSCVHGGAVFLLLWMNESWKNVQAAWK